MGKAQEDPDKYFGTTDYFPNKDAQRRKVNELRREDRNKRMLEQYITRNAKKIGRDGGDPSALLLNAKKAGLDPLKGGGLGPEAGQANIDLKARANTIFEQMEAARLEQQGQSNLNPSNTQGVATLTGGMVKTTPAVNNQPTNVPATNAQGQVVQSLPFVGPPSPVVESAEPTWWKDVENDRTFKPFSPNDPRFAGKTREEARKEIMSEKSKNLMSGFNKAGRALADKERDYRNQVALENQNRILAKQKDAEEQQARKLDNDTRVKAALDPDNIKAQKDRVDYISNLSKGIEDRLGDVSMEFLPSVFIDQSLPERAASFPNEEIPPFQESLDSINKTLNVFQGINDKYKRSDREINAGLELDEILKKQKQKQIEETKQASYNSLSLYQTA